MRMITFLFAKLRPNRTWMKSTQKTRVRMGKIQGDAVKNVDDAAAAAETHKAPVKPSTSKKNMRLFTMRRKAIAELTKECSDMQKAGDPGGQERFVHIQLALEQNCSTNDKQPKIYGIFDLFMIVRERLDGALHSDECIGKGGLWVAACPHSDRPGCKSRVGHQFSIWIHSEGLISTGDLDQFNAIWSSFIGFFFPSQGPNQPSTIMTCQCTNRSRIGSKSKRNCCPLPATLTSSRSLELERLVEMSCDLLCHVCFQGSFQLVKNHVVIRSLLFLIQVVLTQKMLLPWKPLFELKTQISEKTSPN